MSPTLLELIVAILLLWVAWQIGALIAPRVLASVLSFWRTSKSPRTPDQWRSEKNVTPSTAADAQPPLTHGPLRK